MNFRAASIHDVETLSEIYIDCFPNEPRSLLGKRICAHYFKLLVGNPAYAVPVVLHHQTIAGFAVILLNQQEGIKKTWLLKYWPRILFLSFKHPKQMMPMYLPFFKRFFSRRLPAVTRKKSPPIRKAALWDYYAVRKKFRSKGIGSYILKAGIELVKTNRLNRIEGSVVKSNHISIKVLESMGFSRYADTKIEYKYMMEF